MSAQGVEAGKAFVTISGNLNPLIKSLKQMEQGFSRISSKMKSVGASFIKFGAAVSAPLALAVKTGAEFEDQMARVRSVLLDIPTDTFDTLTEKAKELGRTTSFTATEVSKGMENLSRAGFTAAETLEAIPKVLNLARAGALDLAVAADIAANVSRQFQLPAKEIARVADVLAITAAKSNTTVGALGESMKFVALSAKAAGQSVEETSLALAVMANAGLRGSIAGTSLDNAFRKLVKPSKEGAEIIKRLGLNIKDASGEFRPITELLADLGRKLEGMPGPEKLRVFQELFGIRGKKAALAVAALRDQLGGLSKDINNSTGTVDKMAKVMDDTFAGSLRKMLSALEGVKIAIFDSLQKPIRAVIDVFTTWFQTAIRFIDNNKNLIIAVGALGVAMVALGSVLLGVGVLFGVIGFAITGIITVFSTLIAVWGALGVAIAAVASPVALVSTAVIGLALSFVDLDKVAGGAFKSIEVGIGNLILFFEEFIGSIRIGGVQIKTWLVGIWLSVEKEWISSMHTMVEGWEFFKAAGRDAANTTKGTFAAMGDAITSAFFAVVEEVGAMLEFVLEMAKTTLKVLGLGKFVKEDTRVDPSGVRNTAKETADYYKEVMEEAATASDKVWTNFEDKRLARAKQNGEETLAIQKKIDKVFKDDVEARDSVAESKSEKTVKKIKDGIANIFKGFSGVSSKFETPALPGVPKDGPSGGVEVFGGGNISEQLGVLSSGDEMVTEQKKSNEFLESIDRHVQNQSSTATYGT